MRRASRGFTLIELLVAVAIVAIVGVIAFAGFSQFINEQTKAREATERWQRIQLAMRLVTQDLAQLHPRATREEQGETYLPSILADPSAQFALEFSRAGWANPAGLPRGTVLRVAYDWEEDELIRWHWTVMDRTMSTPPVRQELLDGVDKVEVRFLDTGGQWHLDWPPVDVVGPPRLTLRPRAVEFAIELEGYGRLVRLVETSG